MARFDEQKRLDLSASVEEAMRNASLQEVRENDIVSSAVFPSQDAALIPPLLSLQSKPLPAVRSGMSEKYKQTHVATVPPLPVRPIEAVVVRGKQPMTRRTTKVRLQVVSEPQPLEELPATPPAVPIYEAITHPGLVEMEEPEAHRASSSSPSSIAASRPGLPAMGTFARGQCDLAVPASSVTTSSVVLVVLTGDPGPVVVQYVSLQPGMGFTIHLSAPTQNITPFNYVIL